MEKAKWLSQMFEDYNSGAKNVFLLYGNTQDVFPSKDGDHSLCEHIRHQAGERAVVIHADPSSGVTILKGAEILEGVGFDHPHPISAIGRMLLYLANLPNANHAAIYISDASYLIGKDNNALDALTVKRWAEDPHFRKDAPFIVLVSENLHSIHPAVKDCGRIQRYEIPLPGEAEIASFLESRKEIYAEALCKTGTPSEKKGLHQALAGTRLQAVDSLLRKLNFRKEALLPEHLGQIKEKIVSEESRGMLEFLPSKFTLDALAGSNMAAIRTQFEGDIALWKSGRTDLAPNGYLFCGPPGTGKTFFVRCLSGSAGIPVLKINNFRGEFQGATENNLELIFRLVKGLPKVYLFIDEAEQWLGNRNSSASDGGVSSRVYSYFAQEMSNPENKGRICWILATSHPQLLEIDLKRPGRIDVKIPLFPCKGQAEGKKLLADMARLKKITLPVGSIENVPDLLTPGGANSLLEEIVRRSVKAGQSDPTKEIVETVLTNYQSPNPERTLELIKAAMAESSSKEFVPATWASLFRDEQR